MLYLKTFLDIEELGITKKFYVSMKNNPYKGYWYNMINWDFQVIGLEMEEKSIKATAKTDRKKTNPIMREKHTVQLEMLICE